MKRRPTKRAFTVVLIGALLVLAASTAQAGWLFVIAAGVMGLLVASLFIRYNLKSARVERDLPRAVRTGDTVPVHISIANEGRGRLPALRLQDRFAAFDPIDLYSDPIPARSDARLELVRAARRRGVYESGEVTLVTGGPFGFVRRVRTAVVSSPLTVLPAWVELRSFPLLEPASTPAEVLHERARMGAGEEFHGVREYRPGDSRRRIHWRSTARAGRLVVREYEEEATSKVVLVLAGSDVGAPPDSAFEKLVSAAASVALYALVTGHPVELVRATVDGHERASGLGRAGVLEWLAAAEPADGDLRALAGIGLGRALDKCTVVFFAPTSGVTAGSLRDAVRTVQTSGSRAFVVAARSSSWDSSVSDVDTARLGAGRAGLRVISAGEDLAQCLQ